MGSVDYHNLFPTREALKDQNVKVVLTSFRTIFGNR